MALMLSKEQLKQITRMTPEQRAHYLTEPIRDVAIPLMLEEMQAYFAELNGEMTPQMIAAINGPDKEFEHIVSRYSNFLKEQERRLMSPARRKEIAEMGLNQKLELSDREKELASDFMLEEMRQFVGGNQERMMALAEATGKNRLLDAVNLINGLSADFLRVTEFYAGYLKAKELVKESSVEAGEPVESVEQGNVATQFADFETDENLTLDELTEKIDMVLAIRKYIEPNPYDGILDICEWTGMTEEEVASMIDSDSTVPLAKVKIAYEAMQSHVMEKDAAVVARSI